jgi:hypothetical protein
LQKHSDKTFIRRIARAASPRTALTLEAGTLASFVYRVTRLYELGCFVKRWLSWVRGSLAEPAPGCTTGLSDPVMLGGRAGSLGR